MPYTTNRDRRPPSLELTKSPWPLAPLQVFLKGGLVPNAYDLAWDDPSILTLNSKFQICGVNIYRSFDSEYGPYHRITDVPIGSSFWRDQTDIELVVDEDVSDKFIIFGAPSTGHERPRYVFKTIYQPIVKSASQGIPTNDPLDVQVWIDGKPALIRGVQGVAGEVEIDPTFHPNVAIQNFDPTVIPTNGSVVTCTYRRLKSLLKRDLAQRVFYRITTVGVPSDCDMCNCTMDDMVETPLEYAAAVSNYEIEKLDYIWREAVRRNRWILEQGGERVRFFLKKHVGIPCTCVQFEHHKQPRADCPNCYGTGFFGGYEGPYEGIIAPDDAERRISQKDIGRTVEHAYEVWAGPTPLLSQRDFLVKVNGDRYSIGAVRFPTNRGMVLQQHFNIGSLDAKDIRYQVPMGDPIKYAAVQYAPLPPEEGGQTPITDKQNIPDERELRGHTVTWENITY
jgi:hypothetical protein